MPALRFPAVSFRAKLILAMVLLVGGVSASTLYFARLALQRSYAEALQEQFHSQIAFFVERQNDRLAEIKQLCAGLAGSDALRAALAAKDSPRIYAAAREALMSRSGTGAPSVGREPASGDSGMTNRNRPPGGGAFPSGTDRGAWRGRGMLSLMPFLRVLDAEGNVLRQEDLPPTGRMGGAGMRRPGGPDQGARFDDQLAALTRAVATWDSQEVAYLAPANDTEGRTFLEVVATRVVDPGTGRLLGAVVLGAPLFDRAEEMRDLSDILAGFWLDGRLHTHTIPEPLRVALSERLRVETASEAPTRGDFRLAHLGETYRVFLRLLNPGSPFPHTYQVKLYSLDGVLRTERRLQSIILSISLVVLLAGIGISLLLANRLTLSVRELDAATSEVLRGNFQVRVPVRSRDDVGRLVDSFNQMTDGLAQKDRYRRVLNLVAGARVATQLVDADKLPAGESRRVTVLFCDVREFTARTEGMPPDQVIGLLNTHMTGLTRVVFEHHGFVDKFVGDLIMAVFGAPTSRENDAMDAVACARRMLAARSELNHGAEHPLEVGIGIATGEVIAGLMGSEDRANYTVLGECVNLASRLCAEARPSQILIDAATRQRLGDQRSATALPPLLLKGFKEPVPAWEVLPVGNRPS